MDDIIKELESSGIDCYDWKYYRIPDWYIREARDNFGKIRWFHVILRSSFTDNYFKTEDHIAELFIPKSVLNKNGTIVTDSKHFYKNNKLFRKFNIDVDIWDEVVRICWEPYIDSSEIDCDINELFRTVVIKTIFRCHLIKFSQE